MYSCELDRTIRVPNKSICQHLRLPTSICDSFVLHGTPPPPSPSPPPPEPNSNKNSLVNYDHDPFTLKVAMGICPGDFCQSCVGWPTCCLLIHSERVNQHNSDGAAAANSQMPIIIQYKIEELEVQKQNFAPPPAKILFYFRPKI